MEFVTFRRKVTRKLADRKGDDAEVEAKFREKLHITLTDALGDHGALCELKKGERISKNRGWERIIGLAIENAGMEIKSDVDYAELFRNLGMGRGDREVAYALYYWLHSYHITDQTTGAKDFLYEKNAIAIDRYLFGRAQRRGFKGVKKSVKERQPQTSEHDSLIRVIHAELSSQFNRFHNDIFLHPLKDRKSQEDANKILWRTTGMSARLSTTANLNFTNDFDLNLIKTKLEKLYRTFFDSPIRISVHGMQVAAAAGFVELRNMLHESVEIDIYCPSSSSAPQLKSLPDEIEPHFLVINDAGMYFATEQAVRNYKRELSVFLESHYTIKNHEKKGNRLLLYTPETSQQLHQSIIQPAIGVRSDKAIEISTPKIYQSIRENMNEDLSLFLIGSKALPIIRDLGFHSVSHLETPTTFGLYSCCENSASEFTKCFINAFYIAYHQCANKYLRDHDVSSLEDNYRNKILRSLIATRGLSKNFSEGVFYQDRVSKSPYI